MEASRAGHDRQAARERGQRWFPAIVAVTVFAVLALWVASNTAFPSSYDELQHLSVVRAQAEAPDLFADASRYRVLDAHDLSRWTATANYINHPPLYYLGMAPLYAATRSVFALRIANVVLALLALTIALWAALPRLETAARWPFAILAGAFPKAAVIAGMINNDNLAALAGSLVFAGLLGVPGAAWWIAAGLALAGWSKLTALIALAAVAGIHHAIRSGWAPRRMASREALTIVIGIAFGALPYLVNFARSGALLYLNNTAYFVAPADRPIFHPAGFTAAFLRALAMKWPAAESHLPILIALATLLVPLGLAVAATRGGSARVTATAYLAAAFILLAIHLGFAWSAYQRIGDLTAAQPRYYGILWPGIAFAAAATLAKVAAPVRIVALTICLVPTVLGAIILLLVGL